MEPFSFCVGRRAVTGGAREFQSRFNEKFGTRFRLAPNGGALVAKVTAHSSGSICARRRKRSHYCRGYRSRRVSNGSF